MAIVGAALPSTYGKRRAAEEVLRGSPTVRELIRRSELSEIKEVMEISRNLGMQTSDQALISLVNEGAINEAEALKNADSANNVRLQLKLHREGGVAGDAARNAESAWGGLSLEALEEPEEAGES